MPFAFTADFEPVKLMSPCFDCIAEWLLSIQDMNEPRFIKA
ncbi:hypothetical protein BTN50_1749 (plasmid) [Candidatus Enterovibrio altilux]|uniref:Uncharacterized protein n=1 Tax=Candidatus Enterovibrio altilux TaxID=1927128 RepID=A0A291BB27_9GAMM|nr:hypothetical protein BTN50_1749 [Candidatus Enterovibrio luxaltus]